MFTITHKQHLFETALACRLPKRTAGHLVKFLIKTEKYQGPKKLVTLMKELYIKLALEHSTNVAQLPSDCKRSQAWRGPLRPLYERSWQSRKGFINTMRFFKIVGLFTSPKPTIKDYERLQRKLRLRPDPFSVTRDDHIDLLRDTNMVPTIFFRWAEGIELDFKFPMPTSDKKSLVTIGKCVPEVWMSPSDYVQSLFLFPNAVYRNYQYFKFLFGEMMPAQSEFVNRGPDVAGMVSLLTKDRGLKLRPVANPNRTLQLATYPIHKYLKEFLKKVPSCYCFDQEAGVEWVRLQFEEGKTLSSIDLESASDNIPLTAQLTFLQEFLPHHEFKSQLLDFYAHACRMIWLSPKHHLKIKWHNGTPMGIHGSYYLFTAWIISQFLGIKGMNREFAIVGDDIVYSSDFDDVVLRMFSSFNIPVSSAKSIIKHPSLAEFCGRLIDKYGALPVFKAKGFSLADDPTGLLRQFGRRALNVFTPLKQLSKQSKQKIKTAYWVEEEHLQSAISGLRDTQETIVPSEGGFSVVQLSKMNLLTSEQAQVFLLWGLHVQRGITDTEFDEFLSRRLVVSKKIYTARGKRMGWVTQPKSEMISYIISVFPQFHMLMRMPFFVNSRGPSKEPFCALKYRFVVGYLNERLAIPSVRINALKVQFNSFNIAERLRVLRELSMEGSKDNNQPQSVIDSVLKHLADLNERANPSAKDVLKIEARVLVDRSEHLWADGDEKWYSDSSSWDSLKSIRRNVAEARASTTRWVAYHLANVSPFGRARSAISQTMLYLWSLIHTD